MTIQDLDIVTPQSLINIHPSPRHIVQQLFLAQVLHFADLPV